MGLWLDCNLQFWQLYLNGSHTLVTFSSFCFWLASLLDPLMIHCLIEQMVIKLCIILFSIFQQFDISCFKSKNQSKLYPSTGTGPNFCQKGHFLFYLLFSFSFWALSCRFWKTLPQLVMWSRNLIPTSHYHSRTRKSGKTKSLFSFSANQQTI